MATHSPDAQARGVRRHPSLAHFEVALFVGLRPEGALETSLGQATNGSTALGKQGKTDCALKGHWKSSRTPVPLQGTRPTDLIPRAALAFASWPWGSERGRIDQRRRAALPLVACPCISCIPSRTKKTASRKRACVRVVQPLRKQSGTDRAALGSSKPEAQQDRAGLLDFSPNNHSRRQASSSAPSTNLQGREPIMDSSSKSSVSNVSEAPADVAAPVSYVGVDVSKDSLEVAFKYDAKSFNVRNDHLGIAQLLKRLPSPGTCVVVLEGSGGYEREAIAELLQAGHRVALVNPRQVRQFANGLGHLAKTDPIDARVLAKFGQTVEPPCLIIPTGPQAELKQLVERRRQLVEFQTAETNRQKQLSSKKALISVAEVLKLLKKQIRNLETQITKLINEHDDWQQRDKLIQSHPGQAQEGGPRGLHAQDPDHPQ